MEIPFNKEITLSYIITKLNRDFGLRKTVEIGEIFGTYKNLQRILDPNEKKTLDDYTCNELFKVIEKYSSVSFVATVTEWFSSLATYKNEQLLKRIIKTNLIRNLQENKKEFDVSVAPIGVAEFLQICMENNSPINCIKIAEQVGCQWFDEYEKNVLLRELIGSKIKIQIVENPVSSIMKRIILATRGFSKRIYNMRLNFI